MEEWKICILHHPPKLSFIIAKQKKIRVNNFINIIVVFFLSSSNIDDEKKEKKFLLTHCICAYLVEDSYIYA